MTEYCVIYGSSDDRPEPFIFGVTNNQQLINGFREEHYHICVGAEIRNDNGYDNYIDYEIMEYLGHFITNKMLTDFCDYCTSIFNRIYGITDTIEMDVSYLKFDENEEEIVDDGFGLLFEIMCSAAPLELHEMKNNSIYDDVLDIHKCLEEFLSTYNNFSEY